MSPEQEQVVIEHLPIVRHVAQRIHERLPKHVEMDDLISAGVVGLIDASSKFDPEKNAQFSTYARFRIRGAILDSLRALDWSPRNLRSKARAIEKSIRVLTMRLGRAPSESEIAIEMDIRLGQYQHLLGELNGLEIRPLHVQHSDHSEDDLVRVPNIGDDPLHCCLKSEWRTRLASVIDHLPERDRLVITLYYYEEMTLKEIGLTLGVQQSRVSQIRASAVLRLRALLDGRAIKQSNSVSMPIE